LGPLPAEGETFMIKILLVEDNEINHDMLSGRMRGKGCYIVTAVDGAALIGGGRNLDLILMDMILPIIDG